ncbi:MAG: 16S rRNA (uracil(1498)-N(3))-methyltransferase [Alphaproteobacteria bacterium]|nr:16S rRNA (uracil(1498)-N(3))-methyltransferase [Alphaproteobacteria bacterium]OJV12102.1 MAG: hypothetical protein BGO27_05115 [Alphaproteobacteria bacterium 33-17]
MKEYYKYPRIYVATSLKHNSFIEITGEQYIYIANVMRLKKGHIIRVFNSKGEFLAKIDSEDKKRVTLEVFEQISPEDKNSLDLWLYFPLIKQDRLRFMIEKATELNVTHLVPVITEYTNKANVKFDKLDHYIIDATEQCERLTPPVLHQQITFEDLLKSNNKITVAVEREVTDFISKTQMTNHLFIGCEGGFSEKEKHLLLNNPNFNPISLGETILRAETAAISLLCIYNFGR